jgi:hypothetical protein
MKTSLLTAIAAAALAAGSASAATSITFGGYQTSLNAGEILVTNFDNPVSTANGYGLSATGSFLTGSSGNGAAPAFNATDRDPTQYLSLEGGQSETLTTPDIKSISFYIGSLDSYNSIAFTHVGGGVEAFSGSDIAALAVPTGVANGDQQSGNSNGRYTFTFDTAITGVTLGSTGNSFELSDIGAPGVPEPATWAIMLMGFGGMGAALRSRRKAALTA